MDSARIPFGKPLFLVIDKDNQFANLLSDQLAQHATIVVVSKETIESEKDTVYVPYLPPLPQIPDGVYQKIFFIWSKKEEHLLDPLLQKSREQHAEFFLILKEEEREVLPEIKDSVTIFVVGDIFGQGVSSSLNTFLSHAKQNKRIQLPNMGLHRWYPVLFADAIAKIAEIALHGKGNGEVFVGPNHAVTALSIAHGLQKIDPDLAIDFSSDTEQMQEALYTHHAAFLQYDATSKLQEEYKHIFAKDLRSVKKEASVVFPKKSKKKKNIFPLFYVFYFFLCLIFLPIGVALGSGGVGYFLLVNGMSDVRSGNTQLALQKIQAAEQNILLAKGALGILEIEASAIGQGKTVLDIQKKIYLFEKLSHIAESGVRIADSTQKILLGKTLSPQTDSDVIVAQTKQIQSSLQEISLDDIPTKYKTDFINARSIVAALGSVIDELPQALGIAGDRSYLILFQNNMELRPGGGFIGSYGLLHLHNGAIKDFVVHDVYDADGQLAGHVEPPFAIRRYIPLVHLYLRDSNFDPDFTKDGEIAAHMLSLETGERVDGVGSVDLTAMKGLLQAVGNVYVPSYNQSVTADNFFELTEQHAERNFFPGSTQKKDFLRAFATALLEKLQKQKTINTSILLGQIMQMIDGKHILVSFSDLLTQQPFTLNNLSNSLQDQRIKTSTSFNDFLGVVEANLGVNKVNAFISRRLSHSVVVEENGDVVEKAIITYQNTSNASWPGGPYINYMRLLLPQGALVNAISINNVDQHIIPAITDPKIYEAKTFVAPKGLEVNHETEAGKEVYGFMTRIDPSSTLSVEVKYSIPHAFSLTNQKQTYSLVVWKQAGVDVIPYDLQMDLPQQVEFLDGTIPLVSGSETLSYSLSVAKDTVITASFAKK